MAEKDETVAPAGDTGRVLDDYLTEDQFADELGVTVRTLRNWRAVTKQANSGPPPRHNDIMLAAEPEAHAAEDGSENAPPDTGGDIFSKARPGVLKPYIKSALERRIWFEEAELAALHWEIEQLYLLSDQKTLEYLDRHQRLREMRAILLNRGGQA